MNDSPESDIDKAAAEANRGGLLGEVWGFMKENKKWWLLPLVVLFLVFGLLIFLSSTGAAPFIYTLF